MIFIFDGGSEKGFRVLFYCFFDRNSDVIIGYKVVVLRIYGVLRGR